MRLATFLAPGATEPLAGEVRDDRVVAFAPGATVLERLASGDRTPAEGEAFPLADVTLLAPVPRPRAIFGIGLNYAAHAAEQGGELPRYPIVFMKLPSEIAGYAVADDLSARDLQGRESQWTRAKGFDGSCPWGPWITTADEVPDPGALRLVTHVNGEVRQDSTTADLVFGPQAVVDFIAETCTLEPGDIILAGTPSGVGMALDPPCFLQPGDLIRIEIEGLGAIEHAVQ